MALIGEFPSFYYRYTDFDSFVARLEYVCESNSIRDESKRKTILISKICDDTHRRILNACKPVRLEDKSYKELLQLIKKYAAVASTPVIVDRREFYTAKQKDKEDITAWAVRVQHLSDKCKFLGDLDAILTDRFISGLYNSDVQNKFFEEDPANIDFEKAIRIATIAGTSLPKRKSNRN